MLTVKEGVDMFMLNVAGVALIGLIVWWFWLYKPK